jgi:tetratricopeptide (TPR) repeat protein
MTRTIQLLFIALLMSGTSQSWAQNALDQARQAYARGEYATALTTVEIQILQHESAPALKLRGDCYHKLGEFSKALDDYERAKILGYNQNDLYLHRGICKVSMALHESAKSDLTNYLQRNENDQIGYYWLAAAEYLSMDNKKAMRYLDEAMMLDSVYADAYYLRGAIYADQKKMNLALDDFQEAYRLNPDLHRAKFNVAIIMLDMGQNRNATELLSELKLENTDFVQEILYFKGEALFNLHDLEGACSDWVEAAQLGDHDAESNYKRLCLDKKGKPRFKRRSYYQF